MEQIATSAAMTAWSVSQKNEGLTIGFVPTMGFLHRGHASLMSLLRPRVDRLVVSIYVNPLQFAPNEDLDTYPRDIEGDLATCRAEGVDCVFMPPDLYPDGFSSSVSVHGLTDRLCGASRPEHFDGVTTVVSRLFGVTRCDLAVFGEKDYQQLAVIRRMTTDLALPVEIVPGALIRDDDGLALSSRNKYLSADDRARGLSLHRALFKMATAYDAGITDAEAILAAGREALTFDRLDYLELVDAVSLQPIERVERPARALVAAFFGSTRLIDNVHLGPPWT